VAFRIILVIPHVIVAAFIGAFVVLFTGEWSVSLRDFVMGVLRWNTRVNTYLLLLTDDYPPFSLD
jgi:heme A synthase